MTMADVGPLVTARHGEVNVKILVDHVRKYIGYF